MIKFRINHQLSGVNSSHILSWWRWVVDNRTKILIVTRDKVFSGVFNFGIESAEFKNILNGITTNKDLEKALRKRRCYFRAIPKGRIQSAEFMNFLTGTRICLKHGIPQRLKTVRIKFDPKQKIAGEIFEALRRYVAPRSQVDEREMSRKTAIIGPLLCIITTAIFTALLAIGSLADKLTWREKHSGFFRLIGNVIRLLGPLGWIIVGIVIISIMALYLRNRLKNLPLIRIWKV